MSHGLDGGGREPPPDKIDEPPCGKLVHIPLAGTSLKEIERQAIIEALRMSDWVQKGAAELLSISPRVINYKMKILGIGGFLEQRQKTSDS